MFRFSIPAVLIAWACNGGFFSKQLVTRHLNEVVTHLDEKHRNAKSVWNKLCALVKIAITLYGALYKGGGGGGGGGAAAADDDLLDGDDDAAAEAAAKDARLDQGLTAAKRYENLVNTGVTGSHGDQVEAIPAEFCDGEDLSQTLREYGGSWMHYLFAKHEAWEDDNSASSAPKSAAPKAAKASMSSRSSASCNFTAADWSRSTYLVAILGGVERGERRRHKYNPRKTARAPPSKSEGK